MTRELGPVVTRTDIRSSLAPFHSLPHYRTIYPEVVIKALGSLYLEYNEAFGPLVEANREWESDYQYCTPGGAPINWAVQIDMVGLSDDFLHEVADMSEDVVREILGGQIFEIESSLAMYQLIERIFAQEGKESRFRSRFRAAISGLRQKLGKPIALLAITEQKCESMRQAEFGTRNGEPLTDAEVFDLSGFDRFFGPGEFREYLASNDGKCDYLLYARTSDPVAKLRKPEIVVEHPLLSDPEMRRVIKANALTFNVDAPDMEPSKRINDTKGYMHPMAMAYEIADEAELLSAAVKEHLSAGNGLKSFAGASLLSPGFAGCLAARGIAPSRVESGEVYLRAKPGKGTYGCYGHVRGSIGDKRFRQDLRSSIRRRGRYVVQQEMETPSVTNATDGRTYTYIDRNFLAMLNGCPVFLGGHRALMPLDSVEAQKGRVHGNDSAVWAEIVP